jgi:hypothetical protein
MTTTFPRNDDGRKDYLRLLAQINKLVPYTAADIWIEAVARTYATHDFVHKIDTDYFPKTPLGSLYKKFWRFVGAPTDDVTEGGIYKLMWLAIPAIKARIAELYHEHCNENHAATKDDWIISLINCPFCDAALAAADARSAARRARGAQPYVRPAAAQPPPQSRRRDTRGLEGHALPLIILESAAALDGTSSIPIILESAAAPEVGGVESQSLSEVLHPESADALDGLTSESLQAFLAPPPAGAAAPEELLLTVSTLFNECDADAQEPPLPPTHGEGQAAIADADAQLASQLANI